MPPSVQQQEAQVAQAPLIDSGLFAYHGSPLALPIDPSLYALEQVGSDTRRGKTASEHKGPQESSGHLEGQQNGVNGAEAHALGGHTDGIEALGHGLLDEDFDPALREIVNSLNNAQLSTHDGSEMTPDQAAAAIHAHLTADEGQGLSYRTLEDLERAGFGALFSSTAFQDSHHDDNFLLPSPTSVPIPHAQAQDHSSPNAEAGPGPSSEHNHNSLKRGRGRPPGAKNKPKPGAPPKALTPEPKIPRKRGRPLKAREGLEKQEFDRRREDKAAGLTRPRGRPRKFPGYLVREMRLKKNRMEYMEVLSKHATALVELGDGDGDGRQGESDGRHGEYGNGHGHGHGQEIGEGHEEGEHQDGHEEVGGHDHRDEDHPFTWDEGLDAHQSQSILDAVRHSVENQNHNPEQGQAQHTLSSLGIGMGIEVDNDVPSSRAFDTGEEMEMRRVLGLENEHDS